MGNCFPWPNFNIFRKRKSFETDGKITEYKKPMLVKDILINFSGYGVSISKKPLQALPYNYKLKIGYVYYLFPASGVSDGGDSVTAATGTTTERIKLIITKQELQELLSNKISAEEMCLLGVNNEDDDKWRGTNSSSRWRPVLETIPEGS
ncbi:hypothetical protein JCGZ_12559 [Jatropha curcas]|uniref:Uncharacterized protein n=1 Tax=Jatropha curcas TaxID=180498 RepID=A0A067KAQ3_JATCU|nr:uncharacterized protein LOC105639996 [Jatropha curcas]KDP32098.1 hypothetical protein JCGZ_12559 [Jatropha curcas]